MDASFGMGELADELTFWLEYGEAVMTTYVLLFWYLRLQTRKPGVGGPGFFPSR
jgi:hypothetical protein